MRVILLQMGECERRYLAAGKPKQSEDGAEMETEEAWCALCTNIISDIFSLCVVVSGVWVCGGSSGSQIENSSTPP